MSSQPGANLYTVGFGTRAENVEVPTLQRRAPASTDIAWPQGKRWVDVVAGSEYVLTSFSASAGVTSANWTVLGGATTDVNELDGDTGTATPTGGAITIAGGTNVTTSATGSTLTVDLDAAITVATSVTSASFITSGANGVTYSANNIDATGSNTNINVTVTPKGTGSFAVDSGNLAVSSAVVAGNLAMYVANTDNTNAASNAYVQAQSGGTSAGDAYLLVGISGGQNMVIGVDNSTTNDDFVWSKGSAVGTGNLLSFDGSSSTATFPSGNLAVSRSAAAANVDATFANSDNTNAASDCRVYSSVGGTSGGDPMFISLISGGQGYAMGAANQVGGDPFTISSGQNLDTPLITVSSAGALTATTSVTATTSITATLGNITATNGNLVLGTAGNKIASTSVGSGTSAGANSFGTVTLTGGTATVSTTAVTASSIIYLTRMSVGATGANDLGILSVGTVTPATSFVINAWTVTNATALQTDDVSVIGWMIVN